jgi:hypothetical protein
MHRLGFAFASSVLAAVAMLPSGAPAQPPSPGLDPSARHAPADRFATPRTTWGDPDLQGTWPSDQLVDVAFERDPSFGTRNELTDAELAAAQVLAASDVSPGTAPPPHWLERGKVSKQASLVVDPSNGRLPPLTADGARRAALWRKTSAPDYPFRRPEDLTPYDRCISRGVLGSVFPNLYNTGMQIMQVPGLVVIRYEMIHETRLIPLDDRPHLGAALRSYMGDPRGHWEGNTLVVETTNFNGKTGSYGRNGNGNPTSEALRLVERFTLTDADTLQYELTVHDPQTWTSPWGVGFSLTRDHGYALYEYACHEGNYAMANMLKGARAR